jgi:hypothetical protein
MRGAAYWELTVVCEYRGAVPPSGVSLWLRYARHACQSSPLFIKNHTSGLDTPGLLCASNPQALLNVEISVDWKDSLQAD